MENSNIVQLLKTFTKNEIKEFDKFLRSPYFTEGKGLRHRIIYDYYLLLKDFHPHYSEKEFNARNFYTKLYPGTKYNDTTMRKLNSDLLRLAERFLSQIEFEGDGLVAKRNLLIQLDKRQTEKLYLSQFKEMITGLSGMEKDEEYFYEMYNAWKNYYNFYFSSKNIYKLSEPIENINNFFVYVILASLRIYLWALSFFRTSNVKNDLNLFEEIIQHVELNRHKYRDIPQIFIIYNLILLTTGKDEKYFEILKKINKDDLKPLTQIDRLNYFTMMTNFCHDMIHKGISRYRLERFKLDKEYLLGEYFKVFDNLHISYFLAIAKNAVKLKEFKWVDAFCSDYTDKISASNRDFAVNYIKSEIHFTKKEYDNALERLSRLKIEQSNQKQYTRNLMLQIYYETADDEAARSIIDTSRHFLHNDKYLSDIGRVNSLNFVKLTELLLNVREHPGNKNLFKLKKSVSSTINAQNKDWIIEKMDELANEP